MLLLALALVTSTPATVSADMAKLAPGDTIQLVGDFPGTLFVRNRAFVPAVTVDASKATFSTVRIDTVTGLNWTGGRFGALVPSAAWLGSFYVINSANVRVAGVDINAGAGAGNGVTFRNSKGVALVDSRVDRAAVAVSLINVTGAVMTGNDLLGFAIDGTDIANSSAVTYENNSCAGPLLASARHPDCLQMWSNAGGQVTSDVTIRNSTSSGHGMQGYSGFVHPTQLGFRNILIEGVTVMGDYPQGIHLSAAPGSIVRNNRVKTMLGAKYRTSINLDPSVAECGNVTDPGAGKAGVVGRPC